MKHRLRLAALTFLIVVGVLVIGSPALAAVEPLVWDLRAIVSQQVIGGTPKSVATLMFAPDTTKITGYPFCQTGRVYRHERANGRNFVSAGSLAKLYKASATAPWEVRGGSTGTCGDLTVPSGWGVDPLYGYVTFVDNYNGLGLTDYEEYYYAVWTGADGVGNLAFQDYLNKYAVAGAFPPTQTRHGNYSEYTNACTACHGLHSSRHQKLLKGPTVTDLCGTCHDGTGSKYDEVRGTVRLGPSWGKRAYTAAGPFGDQLKDGSGVITTSVHNVYRDNGPDWARVWQAPGSGFVQYDEDGTPNTEAQATKTVEPVYKYISSQWYSKLVCSTCHEPHNRSRNYRILRGVINDWTNIVVRGLSEVNKGYAATDQDPGDPSRCAGATCDENDERGDWTGRAMYTKFLSGTERFCIACHRAFYTQRALNKYPNAPGDQPLDTAAGASAANVWGGHRHGIGVPASSARDLPVDGVWMVGTSPCGMSTPSDDTSGDEPCGQQHGVTDPVLPLQGRASTYTDNAIVCLTCHVPHGSGSERVEVAYRNDGANMTQQGERDPVSGYLWNRADRPAVDGAAHSRWIDLDGDGVRDPGEDPVSPGRDLDGDGVIECTALNPGYPSGSPQTECATEGSPADLYLPNDAPYYTQYGFSSALARFNPLAQACYRCHGLKPQ